MILHSLSLRATLLLFFTLTLGAQQCAEDRGWFIRICPAKTEADSVSIEVGLGGLASSHRYWRDWHRGDPVEFDLPVDLLHAKEVWVKATAHPEKNVSMCIGFNTHITQKMTFDEDEEHETSRDDDDDCEC